MYVPSDNSWEDQEQILAFMQRFSFAAITNMDTNGLPCVTHLPFVVQSDEGGIRLLAHFAKANEQWRLLENQTSLVVFAEPHAYVSPTYYDKVQSVPTWNYQSVHAYGKAALLTEPDAAIQTLEALIIQSEASYLEQWKGLSDGYKAAMLNGIVAFELQVTDLQAKSKLSQNKRPLEQERIAKTKLGSDSPSEQYLGEQMMDYLKKGGQS